MLIPYSGRCWNFDGYIMPEGYGQIRHEGRVQLTHRVAYQILVGPIPVGLDLDHLCRNRACYNPAHLEPVTRAENLRRGRAAAPIATHCSEGHLYDRPPMAGRTRCSICKAAYDRVRYVQRYGREPVRRCS